MEAKVWETEDEKRKINSMLEEVKIRLNVSESEKQRLSSEVERIATEVQRTKAENNVEANTQLCSTQHQLQRITAKYTKAKSIIVQKENENVTLKKNQAEYMGRQLKKAQRLRALVCIKNLKNMEL